MVVDAGLGAPSHAAAALEMGADAVLVNTAIAAAGTAWRRGAPANTSPSQARSLRIADSYSGLQRTRSKSSMRSSRRPPAAAARRAFISAE